MRSLEEPSFIHPQTVARSKQGNADFYVIPVRGRKVFCLRFVIDDLITTQHLEVAARRSGGGMLQRGCPLFWDAANNSCCNAPRAIIIGVSIDNNKQ
ncbi:hypothetical protein pipiens_015160 [Culex pipiens pipiens]|uniref:Uncharacterized protein n=2 Tax=Culex pipiens TaxID=7175 RepID=A0ABD1CSQ6_CULPP